MFHGDVSEPPVAPPPTGPRDATAIRVGSHEPRKRRTEVDGGRGGRTTRIPRDGLGSRMDQFAGEEREKWDRRWGRGDLFGSAFPRGGRSGSDRAHKHPSEGRSKSTAGSKDHAPSRRWMTFVRRNGEASPAHHLPLHLTGGTCMKGTSTMALVCTISRSWSGQDQHFEDSGIPSDRPTH